MLLITGAIGGIHPAKPGSYRADYGALEALNSRLPDVNRIRRSGMWSDLPQITRLIS